MDSRRITPTAEAGSNAGYDQLRECAAKAVKDAKEAGRNRAVIRLFAQRLKTAGKKNKVVIVACMRKLAILLNAMIRDGLMWNELNVVKNA